jgi:hypothetical protein
MAPARPRPASRSQGRPRLPAAEGALGLLLLATTACNEPEAGAAQAPPAQTSPVAQSGSSRAASSASAAPSSTAAASSSSSAGAASGSAAPGTPAAKDASRGDVDRWPALPTEEQVRKPGDRIYSKVRHLWVRPRPGSKAWIGYLSLGDSVRVKDGDAKRAHMYKGDGKRCVEWYRVEPVGFVCTGEDATLDADDPVVVELRRHGADRGSPWPYRYAESLQVPVYPKLPSAAEQRKREEALERHLENVAKARELDDGEAIAAIDKRLLGVDLKPSSAAPPKLLDLPPRARTLSRRVVIGSTLAFTDSFEHEGRSWLMTWDRGFVPKDKVKPYPERRFHGVVLGEDAKLPLAFLRGEDRPKYRRKSDGSFENSGEHWPRLSHVELTGERAKSTSSRKEFLRTRDGEFWTRAEYAAVAERSDDIPKLTKGRRTWVDISILGGTLVAYEGDTPVYATLISPGRGGVPHGDIPTIKTASTPTGKFRVLGKFLTATMTSSTDDSLVHAEVQYTQNFSGPYALHGAYWHDAWGEKKSGGCVNLAPVDARRIFRWTEPSLPEGWRGMRSDKRFGPRTFIRLRR